MDELSDFKIIITAVDISTEKEINVVVSDDQELALQTINTIARNIEQESIGRD